MMNIPRKIPYLGGSYRPFSLIGTSGVVRVYRSLNVPNASIQLKNDYPVSAHRILKILPRIQVNQEEFNVLVEDERNVVFTHPNLIKVERSFVHIDSADFVIAMEDMSGSVHDLLKSKRNVLGRGMPEKTVCFILKEVLEGLSYIHSEGLQHNSLDTWSIFYNTTKSPAIKLNLWAANFDLGVLRRADTRKTGNRRITKKVQCPERRGLIPNAYTSMSDIWHLGLTAIEMSIGEIDKQRNERADHFINLFHDAHQQPMSLNMIGSSSKFPNMQVRGRLMKKSMGVTVLGHHFSPLFVDFVVQCTHNLPQERPEAQTLLNHPFLKTYMSDEAEFQRSMTEALIV